MLLIVKFIPVIPWFTFTIHIMLTKRLYHGHYIVWHTFLDPEGGSQKATLVVLVVISSLNIHKAFLIRSGAQ